MERSTGEAADFTAGMAIVYKKRGAGKNGLWR